MASNNIRQDSHLVVREGVTGIELGEGVANGPMHMILHSNSVLNSVRKDVHSVAQIYKYRVIYELLGSLKACLCMWLISDS